jgi:hypothetical protein
LSYLFSSFALAKGLELKNALLQPRFVTALDRLFQTDWQSLASVRSSNKRHFSTIDLISPRMLPNKTSHSADLASVHTRSNPTSGRDRSMSVDEPSSNEATVKLSELKLNERETQAITATLTAAASAAPIPTPPLWLLQVFCSPVLHPFLYRTSLYAHLVCVCVCSVGFVS